MKLDEFRYGKVRLGKVRCAYGRFGEVKEG